MSMNLAHYFFRTSLVVLAAACLFGCGGSGINGGSDSGGGTTLEPLPVQCLTGNVYHKVVPLDSEPLKFCRSESEL